MHLRSILCIVWAPKECSVHSWHVFPVMLQQWTESSVPFLWDIAQVWGRPLLFLQCTRVGLSLPFLTVYNGGVVTSDTERNLPGSGSGFNEYGSETLVVPSFSDSAQWWGRHFWQWTRVGLSPPFLSVGLCSVFSAISCGLRTSGLVISRPPPPRPPSWPPWGQWLYQALACYPTSTQHC